MVVCIGGRAGMVTIGMNTSQLASGGDIPCRLVVSEQFMTLHPGRRIQLIGGMVSYIKKLAAATLVDGQIKEDISDQVLADLEGGVNYDVTASLLAEINEDESSCEIDVELSGGWAALAPHQHSRLYTAIIHLLTGTGMTIARRDMQVELQNTQVEHQC